MRHIIFIFLLLANYFILMFWGAIPAAITSSATLTGVWIYYKKVILYVKKEQDER